MSIACGNAQPSAVLRFELLDGGENFANGRRKAVKRRLGIHMRTTRVLGVSFTISETLAYSFKEV